MASGLNPYLSFRGDAREAMEFYQSVFGGELTVNTFGEFGTEGPDGDKVMHSQLETDSGYTVMGADTIEGRSYAPGDTVTVCIMGDEGDKLRGYWAKLTEGAEVAVPLEPQMWGDEYGQFIDRFGTPWMFNISAAPAG